MPSRVHHSPLQPSTAHNSPVQPIIAAQLSTAQYSPLQPSTAHYSLVQSSAVQYSPVEPTTVQYNPPVSPHSLLCLVFHFSTESCVNPHVHRVQNMYSKGGYGVFKAELRPAEVDPSSEKIFSQKFFSLGLLHYIIQPKVAVTKNRHSIFCPNALRIK